MRNFGLNYLLIRDKQSNFISADLDNLFDHADCTYNDISEMCVRINTETDSADFNLTVRQFERKYSNKLTTTDRLTIRKLESLEYSLLYRANVASSNHSPTILECMNFFLPWNRHKIVKEALHTLLNYAGRCDIVRFLPYMFNNYSDTSRDSWNADWAFRFLGTQLCAILIHTHDGYTHKEDSVNDYVRSCIDLYTKLSLQDDVLKLLMYIKDYITDGVDNLREDMSAMSNIQMSLCIIMNSTDASKLINSNTCGFALNA